MWKKDDAPDETSASPENASRVSRRSGTGSPSRESATIGRSIRIRGEVAGDEDLLIQGHVDGTVQLKEHSVTVGADGEVTANITARIVTVEGTVEGDITADEQVTLRPTADVVGDITAPRVILDDGARFRGGVDMGEASGRGRSEPEKRPSGAGKSLDPQSSRSSGQKTQGDGPKPDPKSGNASDAKAPSTTKSGSSS